MRTARMDAAHLAVVVAFTTLAATACASPDRPSGDPPPDDQSDVLLCQGNEVPVQAQEITELGLR